jgi:hypothetical protein
MVRKGYECERDRIHTLFILTLGQWEMLSSYIPSFRSPSLPLQFLIRKVLKIMATVSEATYEDITMASGNVIRVVNSMTLGEILIFVSLALLTLTLILFIFSNQIWRGKHDGNV